MSIFYFQRLLRYAFAGRPENMRWRWRNHTLIPLLLVLSVAFAGCASVAAYKVPIGNYKEANSLVVEDTRTIIQQANQVERAMYIDRQVRNRSKINLEEVHGVELFSQDQLATRMKALDTIDTYGTLLLKIANSDAPKSISEAAGSVTKDAANLTGMIAKLKGQKDTAFKNAADPLAKLVSEVANLAIDKKIKEALNKAVEDGYGPISGLIENLDIETHVAFDGKQSLLIDELTDLKLAYNSELEKGKAAKEDALKKYADQIKANLNNLEQLQQANPSLLFNAMEKAQIALLAYARSGKTPKDTDEFTYAMEEYLSRVKQVGTYIKKLYSPDTSATKSNSPGTSTNKSKSPVGEAS